MFAIVETGGKQYKATQDGRLQVERLDSEVGELVSLDRVLILGDDKSLTVGTPFLDGASVQAQVVRHGKAKKIVVFKKKRRKKYRRRQGHRQQFTELLVTEIKPGG
jgi:large subunit ribosomal protein L21